MESAVEFEDLDALVSMLDSDMEDDAEEPTQQQKSASPQSPSAAASKSSLNSSSSKSLSSSSQASSSKSSSPPSQLASFSKPSSSLSQAFPSFSKSSSPLTSSTSKSSPSTSSLSQAFPSFSKSTSPSSSKSSQSSTSRPSHAKSPSSDSTMADLGLVLSDDEDQGSSETVTVKSKSGAKKGQASNVKEKKIKKIDTNIDPLEAELQKMEERVKMLKQKLVKKRKFDDEEGAPTNKFSKLTNATPQGPKKQSSRTLSTEETLSLYNSLKKTSVLHKGDTDSEDEEDNRNPMEQTYNDCGRDIKKRIAHETSQVEDRQRDRILDRVKQKEQPKGVNKNDSLSQGAKGKESPSQGWQTMSGSLVALRNGGMALPDTDKNVSVDGYSGIRIINPLVSSDQMRERMESRKMVRMSTITLHLRGGEIEGDWVTIGVLVSKSDPKTSQKGSQFSIWKLSDLSDCTKTVAVFLFSGAHKMLWKSSIGTVIGLLNPTIMKDKKNDNYSTTDILSVSIFEAHRAMLMGSAKDLGWCKGTTKQNQKCRSFVNKASCEFCVYHIQREYQKSSSKRSDIQSSFNRVDPKRRLQEKVLGKDQVFYGGQLYTAPAATPSAAKLARANKGKDLVTLNSLKLKLKTEQLKEEDKRNSFVLCHLSDKEINAVQDVAQKNDALGERLLAPTPGARNLLRHMAREENTKKEQAGTLISVTARDLLNMTHKNVQDRKQQQDKTLARLSLPTSPSARPSLSSSPSARSSLSSSPRPSGPQLGRGVQPGGDIDLEISPPPKKLDIAKVRAMALLQKKGGIQAKDPNAVKNRTKASDPKFQDKVQQRLNTSTDSQNDEGDGKPSSRLTEAMTDAASRSKLGALDVNSDKFKAMMSQKSRHTNLVNVVENEALEKYYQGLEKKEMMEDKMASIMEIRTTAYACLKCKYLAESASDMCKEENHPLKTIKAKKRFFECRNCKRRTSSLDKLPRKACPNCQQSSWQRVAMGKAKSGPKLDSEILSLRGDELKHYSASSNQIYLHI